MRSLKLPLLFVFFSALGILIFDTWQHRDIVVLSTYQAQRNESRQARLNAAAAGQASEKPGLDRYFFPRIWNADRTISRGLREATATFAEQAAMRKPALGVNWTFVGPSNIGGRNRVVKYNPRNPSILYAGSASGGLFKSEDGGNSWRPLTDHLPTLAIGHMAFDPIDPEIIYIGTGEGSFNWDKVYGDGLYKSTDGGLTWENIMKDVVRDIDFAINQVVVHPDDRDMIFVAATFGGGSGALFRTTDGGENWQAILNGPARDVVIDPFRPNRVITAFGNHNGRSSNGLYVSDSLGQRFTFAKITENLPFPDSIGRVVLDASLSEPGMMICAMSRAPKHAPTRSQDFLGVFRTLDHGETWEKMPASTQSNMREVLRGQGDYNLFIKIHPTDPTVVFLGGIHTWRSTNGGASFNQVTSQTGVSGAWVDFHYADFHPTDPRQMALASDGGIFMTTDCFRSTIVMTERNNGLATMQFYAMDFDPQNTSRVAGGTQDRRNNLGHSFDPDGWSRLNWGGDGGYVAFDFKDSSVFYITSQYGNLAKTTNGGASFRSAVNGLQRTSPSGGYLFGFVTPFVIHPVENQTLFVGGNRIYRTTNGATSWTPISGDLVGGATSTFSFVQDMVICKGHPNVLYSVTGSSARVLRSDNILDPPDKVEFRQVDDQLPRLFLRAIEVHPTNPDIAYVGISAFSVHGGVYKTTDGGVTWTQMNGETEETSLPTIPVNAVSIYEKNPAIVFAGTDVGVYMSRDGGLNWKPYGDGLPNVVIDHMKITHDNILYAATHGRGMWMTSILVSAREQARPITMKLEQNYPNPFNPSTVVPFTLGRSGQVSIRIYDTQGRLLRTVLDEYRVSGEYEIAIDATGLQSGTYFYVLESGEQRETRKMMLIK